MRTVTWGAGLLLAAGFAVLFVGGGARFALGLTLKPMVDELGWARSDLGIAIALFQVMSAIFSFWAGRLADRMDLRMLLVTGLLIGALGIGLMSVMTQPWHALLLYGVAYALGNGLASLTPVGVMVTRAFPGRTGTANAIATSGMSLGQLVMIAALAAVLVSIGWRSVFVWAAVAQLVLIPFLFFAIPNATAKGGVGGPPPGGLRLREAARTRQFWMLLVIYAVCGLDDFFVATHVVAFAQDQGLDAFFAGNLLAFMGLAALIGVLAAGAWSDRTGPVPGTALSFAARVAVFGLIAVDQSTVSVAVFALVFGATFMVTAPLTVLFVRESFGSTHLGSITGLITMVHQMFGGLGAYLGSVVFDATGTYDIAFITMLVCSVLALLLTLMLRRPAANPVAA